jgi:hypothetical protein
VYRIAREVQRLIPFRNRKRNISESRGHGAGATVHGPPPDKVHGERLAAVQRDRAGGSSMVFRISKVEFSRDRPLMGGGKKNVKTGTCVPVGVAEAVSIKRAVPRGGHGTEV